ncbi:MAG: DUF692 family protein [Myxococcales bacterium]|nr:DUF692 family protein [Myxococcales bacterium]
MPPLRPPAIASRFGFPDLGLGLGLRAVHHAAIERSRPPVAWFEVITDNALAQRGAYRARLHRLRAHWPLVLHGVSLDIGGVRPLDLAYVRAIGKLADELRVPWVSDHVSWTGHGDLQTHDLLPVPYTRALLDWIVDRVAQVQDVLGRPLVLENPSSYVKFRCTTLTEWDFLAELVARADCALLLDLNNVVVAAHNHGFDPQDWLAAVPWDRVAQFHVAGHTTFDAYKFDSHIGPVPPSVWDLWADAQRRTGGRATLLEWDDATPDLDTVWQEALRGLDRVPWWDPHPAPPPQLAACAAAGSQRGGEPGREAPAWPAVEAELFAWMNAEVVGGRGAGGQVASRYVFDAPGLPADARIEIHRSMYRERTRQALADDFPATVAGLGAERFAAVCAEHRREHPSRSWALEAYGAAFPAFLASRQGDSAVPPWLVDLARLERARTEAWLAAEVASLEPAALFALPPERAGEVTLTFAPAFRIVDLAWDVAALACDPDAAAGAAPLAFGRQVLLARSRFRIVQRPLHPLEAALLRALAAGQSLGQAALAVAAGSAGADIDLATDLPRWLQAAAADGAVVGVALMG